MVNRKGVKSRRNSGVAPFQFRLTPAQRAKLKKGKKATVRLLNTKTGKIAKVTVVGIGTGALVAGSVGAAVGGTTVLGAKALAAEQRAIMRSLLKIKKKKK